MTWALEFSRSALKAMSSLPAEARSEVAAALERLVDDPASADLRKLRGRGNEWRLRVRDWRVILRLDNKKGTMYVQDVRPRGSAYRE